MAILFLLHTQRFQSTLPTRGSDDVVRTYIMCRDFISIHAPHEGERRGFLCRQRLEGGISIHAPHEGERRICTATVTTASNFNPRSPRGGATAEKCICIQHFREFAEYYPLRHGDARCIAPQDCIIQAFFGAKKRCFYVRLCFALKNKGVRG